MEPTDDPATIRLYYYTAKRWGLKVLWERRLKIAQYKDVNDPFELIPFDRTRPAARRFWDAQVERLLAADHGVVCFSDDWRNPLMWSQYGDKHTGVCLGFDVLRDYARPMTYVDAPLAAPAPAARVRRLPLETLEAALRYKHAGWRHEREWRVRAPLGKSHDGVFYLPFDAGIELREVILGPRCTLEPQDIVEPVQSPPQDVEIYAARAAYASFAIERHELVSTHTIGGYRAALARASVVYADAIFDDAAPPA